jgi:ADP-heptose:LPS heptosyltransferase
MHLAAAVARPVVAAFAATVPRERWRPWGVPHVVLGDDTVTCRHCRHVTCPLPVQHCLAGVDADAVLEAVGTLTRTPMEVAS